MDETIVDFLQSTEALRGVPREQLEWLVRESDIIEREPGIWTKPGEGFDYMLVLLEGKLDAYTIQNGQKRPSFVNVPGSIGGVIPFSRMKSSPVFIEAIGHVKTLALHRSKFHALIANNYELTEVLVHSMVDRVRMFTSAHFQNEKLMALGNTP